MSTAFSNGGKYVWIWEKYRPVILKLMMASSENPQTYQLSKHEFTDTNNKNPRGYSFNLRVNKGKYESDIKKSLTAQDLLYMLNRSEKAKELMESNLFEFKMDKSFILSVSRNVN